MNAKLSARLRHKVHGLWWHTLVTQIVADGDRITVCGGGGGKSLILVSNDGGKHFEDQRATVGVREVMHQGQLCGTGGVRGMLRESNVTYVCGESGLLARSFDDGQTFEEIDVGAKSCFQTVLRADGALWVTGDPGVWRSTDDGKSWNKIEEIEGEVSRPTASTLGALIPSSNGRLYLSRGGAIHSSGLLAEGAIWAACETPRGTLLAVGNAGAIWRSTDEGATFTRIDAGTEASLERIATTDAGRVAVVGAEGVILVSDDDGQSFERVAQKHTKDWLFAVTTVGETIWVGGPGYVLELVEHVSLDELFTTRDPLQWLDADLTPLFAPATIAPLTALERYFGTPLPELARMQAYAPMLDTETCWEWTFGIDAPRSANGAPSFAAAFDDATSAQAALAGLLKIGSNWNGDDIYLAVESGEVVGFDHEEGTFDSVVARTLSAFAYQCMAFAAFRAERLSREAFAVALERVRPHVCPTWHFQDAEGLPETWGEKGHYDSVEATDKADRIAWIPAALGLADDDDDVSDVFVKKLNPKLSDKQHDARLALAETSVSEALYGLFRSYLFSQPARLERWLELARGHRASVLHEAAALLATGEFGGKAKGQVAALDPDRATKKVAAKSAGDVKGAAKVTKVRLELAKGTKRDFWQIEVDGDTQTITTGTVDSKKPPKQQSKTLETAAAAAESAAKEIAKKKAALYFDPSTIAGILEAHVEQLVIPSEEDLKAHRKALPHASEDYFDVYRTGALSVGFLCDFAPTAERPAGEFGEMRGLFPAYSASDELDDDASVLDPFFYVVGSYPDGSAVVHYNQGKYAGRLGLIEHGPSDDLLEHVVEGDVDATVAAWLEESLIEPISTLSFSTLVRTLLLHYKGAAVERTQALRAAVEVVKEAVAGDPLAVIELDLADKELRALPEFLGECKNLEVLTLRKNELTAVPAVLRSMTKLRVLDLYYNSIDIGSLPGWLNELPLTTLNLDLNDGCGFPPVLAELTGLQELVLPEVDGLPATIGALSALRRLEVDGVDGPIEEGGLGRLTQLETLELGQNAGPLPADLGALVALRELKFAAASSELFPLPASVARLRSLRVLHAQATLVDAVCELDTLEELKVSGNEAGLPGRIGALRSLKKLDLHFARMKELPESIGDLQNLEHLNLESAYLEALPDSFTKLTQLRFLNLATAVVTEIGDRLFGLENLEHLALKVSGLRTIRGSWKSLCKLHTLKVYSGTDDVLDPELFAFVRDLPALKTLGVPYEIKATLRQALPDLEIT